jgi:hypothetical protein
LPLKRYKVTIEFVLDIEDLTDERATEAVRYYSNFAEIKRSPEHWQHVERQRHLLDELLRDEDALQEYVRNEAAGLVELEVGAVTDRLGTAGRDEEILAPVITRLPDEDIEAFETAIEEGMFAESTEEFSTCLDLNLRRASIDEIIYDEG